MKLRKHNKKGMTLVECIIAMALLGVMSAMLVTIAVAAKKQNLANYQRSQEMYAQAARIESYAPTANYKANHIKVSALISKASGASGNVFKLKADFGTYKLDTTTYGYKALPTGTKDKTAQYTLKSLKSEYDTTAAVLPDLTTGYYVIKFYNYSGAEHDFNFKAPDNNGGTFYDAQGKSAGLEFPMVLADTATVTAGFRATSTDEVFTIYIEDSAVSYTIDSTRFQYFMEKDEKLNPTGYVYFYLDQNGDLLSKETYDENYGTT